MWFYQINVELQFVRHVLSSNTLRQDLLHIFTGADTGFWKGGGVRVTVKY